MITTWLQDHDSNRWTEALNFVQFMKNSALHAGIKTSPYEAMFGCKPKVGLRSSNIPFELLANISTEEELENLIKNNNSTDSTPINENRADDPIISERMESSLKINFVCENETVNIEKNVKCAVCSDYNDEIFFSSKYGFF